CTPRAAPQTLRREPCGSPRGCSVLCCSKHGDSRPGSRCRPARSGGSVRCQCSSCSQIPSVDVRLPVPTAKSVVEELLALLVDGDPVDPILVTQAVDLGVVPLAPLVEV